MHVWCFPFVFPPFSQPIHRLWASQRALIFGLSEARGKDGEREEKRGGKKERGREMARRERESCFCSLPHAVTMHRAPAMKMKRILFSKRLILVISLFPMWMDVICTEQLCVRARTQTHECTLLCLKSPL